METNLTLLPNGSQLETSLVSPPEGATPSNDEGSKLAVLLHPWSLVGGRMNDPRLISIARLLRDRGYHVLLFNSRGVGRSKGWPSPSGSQESKDLHALIQWAIQTLGGVHKLLIVGYSHGSLIASTHLPLSSSSASDTESNSAYQSIRTAHVLLSYPLGVRSLITFFNGSKYETALIRLTRRPDARILLLYGDEDEFTSVEKYREWAGRALKDGLARLDDNINDNENREERVRSVCVEGTGHFWAGPEFEPPLRAWLDDFNM